MSQQAIDILVLTIVASAAITGERFMSADGSQTGADGNAIGVARSDGVSGDAVAVTNLGTAVVEAGGAFAVGDPIASDASGKAVKMDGTTYTVTIARALEAAAAAGDKVEVSLIPN